MDVKIKEFFGKVKDFFKNMSKKMRIVLAVTVAVLLVGIIAFVVWANNKPYEVLATGLSSSDLSSVVSFLSENSVTDYRIEGDSVLVRADQEPQLKAQMVLAGYPRSGFLYESYFGNINSLSTTSERDRAWLVGLQQKLEAVIRCFEGVREAQVSIAPGHDATYVLDDSNKTSASATVVLEIEGGNKLSNQIGSAIQDAVAHAVEGLTIDNVTIKDQYGNNYGGGDTLSSLSEGTALKLRLEQETNNLVRSQVLQALNEIYGPNNVQVAVTSVVDVSRRIVENTSYAQPEGAPEGAGLIGTQTWYYQRGVGTDGTVGGPVGTLTNSEIPTYVNNGAVTDGDENLIIGSSSSEHDNDKSVEQVEVLAGTITDISVAVTINANSPNAWSVDEEVLRNHVARAGNIGGEEPAAKVSILIAPFFADTPEPIGPGGLPFGLPDYVLYIAAGVLALLLILTIVLVLLGKKKKKKKLEEQKLLEEQGAELTQAEAEAIAAATAAAAAAGDTGADIMEINTEKSMELRKSVRQFAQNNPEIAAQMIKAWLRGGDENG